ncbi:MAG: ATP synthase F1 subunit delta [Cellulosilyticaceae bacterium]
MAQLVTKRYATALYEIAKEKGAIESFQHQAEMLVKLIGEQDEYLMLLSHPGVLVEEKMRLIDEAFSKQVEDEFVGLLALIVKKGRQDYILDILNAFIDLAKTEAGLVQATVTSAIALQEKQLAQIKANIEQNTGKQVELEVVVDKTLIGGLIVRVGDKVVDGSVRGQMNTLKSELSNLRLA